MFCPNNTKNATDDSKNLQIASTVSCVLSMFGAVVIMMTYCCMETIRNTTRKLVTVLSVADFFTSAGVVIAVALYHDMLGREDNHGYTIGTGPWCWVKCKDEDNGTKTLLYMLFTGKFWEIGCYVLTAGFYILLKLKLYLHHRFHTLDQLNPDLRSDDRNFLYVWLVLLAIRIWGTIRFLITAFSTNDKLLNTILLYLQAVGDPSQAFFNCILFCLFDTEVRGRIANAISCCVPRKTQSASNEPDASSSLPSVDSSVEDSQSTGSSSEIPDVSERAKLVNKENPGHEKLYQSVNHCWKESNEGSM
ncbi:G-protein coupled receptor 157-like isoform X2 [Dreissena polymorpha]|uniref:G-protein coupled receptor 157-like isoform X2 n=1 Tax=Dreissena polymorpha TaxID=45954 RepID=UPI002264EB3C|nr:G-protein coupled receptor 157-like isoform X2 [Dreissena polymorpha]